MWCCNCQPVSCWTLQGIHLNGSWRLEPQVIYCWIIAGLHLQLPFSTVVWVWHPGRRGAWYAYGMLIPDSDADSCDKDSWLARFNYIICFVLPPAQVKIFFFASRCLSSSAWVKVWIVKICCRSCWKAIYIYIINGRNFTLPEELPKSRTTS